MQIPEAYNETGLHDCDKCPFSLQQQFSLFFPRSGQSDKIDNEEPLMGFLICL
jgi:hypothetical protein